MKVQQRIANQRHDIAVGLRSGKLTQAEGAKRMAKLDALQARVDADAFDGNGMTGQYTQPLDNSRKALNKDLHDAQSNLGDRVAYARRRIENGLKNGTLTQEEAAGLKSDLRQARQLLRDSRAKGLTPAEREKVNKVLDRVDRRIDAKRENGQYNATKRLENFQKRIDAGLADGSLTQEEAEKLKTDFTALKNKVAGAKGDGTMNDAEHRALKDEMNAFSDAIYARRHDGTVDETKRPTAISGRIDTTQQSGRLGLANAQQLKAQLAEVQRYAGSPDFGARLNALNEQITALLQR